ncbi:RNI-like protein [Piromyces finnis]|uniref:RNI-like protein n=1 Tax=Piromyces finnis TaxID=1754191 RepID=A0A1Y1VGS8_9FUNG|nr:RNI-like protein [Piromyces finnis]|eukprot:ORX55928.1 RNI-like protein [Piromyces finnis]
MNIKSLLKGISLSFLISKVLAQSNKDCEEIKSFLEEKNLVFDEAILSCNEDNTGKVTTLQILDYDLSDEIIQKLLSYKTITNLYYGIFNLNSDKTNYSDFPISINSLPNLKELALSYKGVNDSDKGTIAMDVLKVSKELKSLTLGGIEISQNNINEISALTNLEELNFVYCSYSNINYDSLKSLNNLIALEMDGHSSYQLSEIPDFVFTLSKLKNLVITGHSISTIDEKLASLQNLEYLDLSLNQIDAELPEKLNSLSHLKYIDLKGNKNIKGKTLINDNLEQCLYHKSYSLCQSKDMKCFEENISFEPCNDSAEQKESINGLCGNGNGTCPPGECCSKYGHCGVTVDHCNVSKGCQSAFGSCIDDTITTVETPTTETAQPTSNDGRCGEEYGSCPNGECCSKYGWCGSSNSHCSISEGCQSKFGTCSKEILISTNGKCGSTNGKCPGDACCSKYGYCGNSQDYCSLVKGCQPEFGRCLSDLDTPAVVSDKCGKGYGKCPSGKCCSKYGWCGTDNNYCMISNGCQSEFGECFKNSNTIPIADQKISTDGRCGEEYGRCPNNGCCSEHGWCGTSEKYCGYGCQNSYGICK